MGVCGGVLVCVPFQLPCAPPIQQDKISMNVEIVLALRYQRMLYYNSK